MLRLSSLISHNSCKFICTNTHPKPLPFSEMRSLVLPRPNFSILVLKTIISILSVSFCLCPPVCLRSLSLRPSLDLWMGVWVYASVYHHVSMCLSLSLWAGVCGALGVSRPISFSVDLSLSL